MESGVVLMMMMMMMMTTVLGVGVRVARIVVTESACQQQKTIKYWHLDMHLVDRINKQEYELVSSGLDAPWSY